MKKQLIGCHNLNEFICMDDNTIHISSGMILSPGAKDALRNKGVSIIYGEKSVVTACQMKEGNMGVENPGDKGQLVAKIIHILRKDYGVVEEDCIREISLNVMKKLI